MSEIIIKIENCPQNHICPAVANCPADALTQNGFSAPVIDSDKCIMCKKCINICGKKAFVIKSL